MLTPGLSLILLNCMEGIIVMLRISGKAETVIFLMLCKVKTENLCFTFFDGSVGMDDLASVAVLYEICLNLLNS